jgi:DsbC/DsbD-like thiol-disulfide interchange protein
MPTILNSFFSSAAALLLLACAAQAQSTAVLTVQEPPKLIVKRGENPTFALKASMRPGYHANSHTPSEEYLIPMKLTWDANGPLLAKEVVYPKPRKEKFSFSESPLSIFDGDFEIITRFQRAANPQPGPGFITGKLRYQACNDKMCLPPKTVDIKLPVLMQ